jgi:hypothetical protein
VDDVVEAVIRERDHPADPEAVAVAMRAYLDIGDDWLHTEYYDDSVECRSAESQAGHTAAVV